MESCSQSHSWDCHLGVTHAESATLVPSHAFSITGRFSVSQQVNHSTLWTFIVQQGRHPRQGSLACIGFQEVMVLKLG